MFLKRLISGALLLGCAVGVLYLGGAFLSCTLCLVSLLAFRELTGAFHMPLSPWYFLGALGIFAYYLCIFPFGDRGLLAVTVLALAVYLILYVARFPRYKSWDLLIGYGLMVYAGLPLSYICLTSAMPYGQQVVWLILFSSWGADTLAYCVGSLLGAHKLTRRLSPGKSVEGAVGGVLGAAVLGALFGLILQLFKVGAYGGYTAFFFGVICGIASLISIFGDLAASGIKRDHKMKDYADIIPGHGGMMDRIDSTILAAPVVYYLALVVGYYFIV